MIINNIENKRKVVLSIAGSDSCCGAGIQADIKSVAATGGYCATAITAITAQNTLGVKAVEILSNEIISLQIDAIMSDMNVGAVKSGMLPNAEVIRLVSLKIKEYSVNKYVLDPVMVATSGDRLMKDDSVSVMITELLPLATVITPNIPEAERICGFEIKSKRNYDAVADSFKKLGAKALLLKSGHSQSDTIEDYLYDFETGVFEIFSSVRIDTPNTHGTGCTLSSAIASYLSQNFTLFESVKAAQHYVHESIRTSSGYKLGEGHAGVNHFYNFI